MIDKSTRKFEQEMQLSIGLTFTTNHLGALFKGFNCSGYLPLLPNRSSDQVESREGNLWEHIFFLIKRESVLLSRLSRRQKVNEQKA